jgi:hypothetical protein
MVDKPNRASLAEYMRGYAGLAGLGHSPERLRELEPEIATLFGDMAKLWAIPLDGAEMAVSFAVDELDARG